MSNLFYKTDSKNNTGVGTNIIKRKMLVSHLISAKLVKIMALLK